MGYQCTIHRFNRETRLGRWSLGAAYSDQNYLIDGRKFHFAPYRDVVEEVLPEGRIQIAELIHIPRRIFFKELHLRHFTGIIDAQSFTIEIRAGRLSDPYERLCIVTVEGFAPEEIEIYGSFNSGGLNFSVSHFHDSPSGRLWKGRVVVETPREDFRLPAILLCCYLHAYCFADEGGTT